MKDKAYRLQLEKEVITDQAVQASIGNIVVTEQITKGPEVGLVFGLQTGTIYTNLTPEEAREVAETLVKAADKNENRKQVVSASNDE